VAKLGRIALAIAPTRPNVVYATIEARKNGGLYRSDDLGENWQLASKSFGFSVRPFYFSKLVADPKDHQRIYKPGLFLTVSNDGGQTTTDVAQQVHSDLHALWINPDNTNHLVAGTDGGVYRSFDRGATWQFLRNIPVSQFYHVNYDLARPYNIYGGLQDNGSWQAPSRNAAGGIRNNDWKNVGYGDGFHTFADLTDANISYAEYQGGRLLRFHHQTREIKTIQPFPQNNEAKYRFNWNTPFVTSSRNPKVLYVGAQFVFRSTDKGESWQKISPDLTTNDLAKQRQEESGGITIDNSGAENHCTLFTIKDSPLDEQVIWAGSDDGNLQVTRDGGKNWVNVVDKIAGLPRNTWCSNVEPSNFDLGTAYVTFDGHQTGDMKTYVYKTTDFGQSWQSLVTADLVGYAHVIREDLVNKNLLFVGTELGLYVSIDGGKDWARFTGGIPKVAVRDLAIHPREGDLIIATHGRGIYIIDDLSPLRQFKPEMTAAKVTIFPLRPTEIPFPIGEQDFVGDDEFVGSTVGTTAYITYFLKERHVVGDFKIEIYDSSNKLITTLPGGRRRGFNQVTWVPRSKPPKVPPGGSLIGAANTGPALPEGTYTIKLLKNGETFTGQITLVDDPGLPHSKEDRQLQQKTSRELYQMIERLAFITELVSTTRDQARERNKGLKDNDPLAKSLTGLADRLEDIRKVLVVTQEDNFFGIRGQEQLRERLSELYGNVSNYGGRPTQSQLDRVANLRLQIEQAYSNFQGLIARELTEINTKLAQKKLAEIKLVTEEEFKKKEQ
jgi:photosystem II stability/assembly factor-like uncharacterized protein